MELAFKILLSDVVWQVMRHLSPSTLRQVQQLVGDLAAARGRWPTARLPGIADLFVLVELDDLVLRYQVVEETQVLHVRGIALRSKG